MEDILPPVRVNTTMLIDEDHAAVVAILVILSQTFARPYDRMTAEIGGL